MLQEFWKFLQRGNVLDLAVAVVLGTAFNSIVNSLVADIIMPVLGIFLGRIDFSGLAFTVGESVVTYGNFIQAILNFLIIAFALFLIIRAYNRLRRKEEAGEKKPAKEELPRDVVLLTEIRDLLRDGGSSDPTQKRVTEV